METSNFDFLNLGYHKSKKPQNLQNGSNPSDVCFVMELIFILKCEYSN